MCGIAGIWGSGPAGDLEAAMARMVAAAQHRGPDETRMVTVPTGSRSLVLGFDRLAIVDLSPDASQPMRDPATGSWIVFNGEIYNFRVLRAELAADGHRFRSRGDAEVLLTALGRWGSAALPRLRGMYAFAYYDARARRLLLGRDPFGIKPLLYGRLGDAFVFASELRAIRAAALRALTLDREALGAYLAYGAIPEPLTIAREIRALAPGHLLEVDARGEAGVPRPVVVLEDLLREPERSAEVSWPRAVDDVGRVLAASVDAHLVSDVPLGVLLSGGVDSTLVASLAARHVEPEFLTVGFDEPRVSEVAVARTTARRLGGRHHVVTLSADDVLGLLPAALAAMDQPTADGINTFVIARAAAERGIKVLVSGLGGDEVFGGYTTFRKAPLLAARARWLAPLAQGIATLGIGNVAQWRKVAAACGVRDLRDAYLRQRALGVDVPSPHGGLPSAVWDGLATPPTRSDFRRVSYLELVFYLRNQLLRDADVFSSANSVELRVPFLDVDVLRQAWALPGAWHVGSVGRRKRVLRALLARLEPAHPVQRAKIGFVFPWATWLHGPLGAHVAATLGDRPAHDALGLDVVASTKLLDGFRRRDPRVGWAELWSRFVLVEWFRTAGLAAPAVASAAAVRASA